MCTVGGCLPAVMDGKSRTLSKPGGDYHIKRAGVLVVPFRAEKGGFVHIVQYIGVRPQREWFFIRFGQKRVSILAILVLN